MARSISREFGTPAADVRGVEIAAVAAERRRLEARRQPLRRLEVRAPRQLVLLPQVLRPAQVRLLVELVLHRPQAAPHRLMERRQLLVEARAAGPAVVAGLAVGAAAVDAAMRPALRTLTALSTLPSSKWLAMPTACLP